MTPGATINPLASNVCLASEVFRFPIFAILPSLMPRSALKGGVNVPSTIVPPLMTLSNSAMGALRGLRYSQFFYIVAYTYRRKSSTPGPRRPPRKLYPATAAQITRSVLSASICASLSPSTLPNTSLLSWPTATEPRQTLPGVRPNFGAMPIPFTVRPSCSSRHSI